ncbi:MAG TPA: hypothetical protein VFQ61_22100 [Polyangiaceae bacterium]|nr:hypothetical protein [Polyangiaceae bacterium]
MSFGPRQIFQRAAALIALSVAITGASRIAAADPDEDAERARIARELEDTRQRVRMLEERLRRLDSRRRDGAQSYESGVAARCSLPFFLDSSGVKRLRPECAAEAPSRCDYPFSVGYDGIKRFRSSCGRN